MMKQILTYLQNACIIHAMSPITNKTYHALFYSITKLYFIRDRKNCIWNNSYVYQESYDKLKNMGV